MKVKDIEKVTVGKVCIFRKTSDFDFEELFNGISSEIPSFLLNDHVVSVGALHDYVLYIRIDR